MKSTFYNYVILAAFFLAIFSCSVPDLEEHTTANIGDNEISLTIPDGFDFKTHDEVVVTINDPSSYVKYDVFVYTDESVFLGEQTFQNESGQIVTEPVYRNGAIEQLVFSGVPHNGRLSQKVSIPKYADQVYIRRNDHLNFSASIENISQQQVNYTFTPAIVGNSMKSGMQVTDYLYCVNGSGQLFQVSPLTGELTDLSNMPMGSYTAAIDQENKMLYSIGKSSPYPLMKYSITDDSWSTVANLGMGGPRLDYNTNDNLLYFSNGDQLYTFDPTTGANLNQWRINGLHNTNGGDLAFAEDGTLFLCSFSGLYRLELDANNEYQSTRISADNLPFMPTSMTFDSNQELWLADNTSNGNLIIMDTQTGGWLYKYGVNANNNTDLGRIVNDLTTFRVIANDFVDIDTDGDGILDADDSFPNNAEKAFEVFTPSKYGKGTIAFEDLWPSAGDYDFNDMALNYQAIAVLNAQNLAVQIDFVCRVKSNGAGFTNGLGFELKGVSPSLVESVTGTVYTENFINLNTNGTEANQENAVIIFSDNIDNLTAERTISVRFTQPITTSVLGVAPFNPFLIVNKDREKEVHLPYESITSLGRSSFNVSGVNRDPDGNFISSNGLPWAISIVHDFKVPRENNSIIDAYNYFSDWANSGGVSYKDWYKDNPGYRNTDRIQL